MDRIDSLASLPPQEKILPIETKCLMYMSMLRSMVITDQLADLALVVGNSDVWGMQFCF